MITMISPCQNFISETLSSLSFSKRAKKIKNRLESDLKEIEEQLDKNKFINLSKENLEN